MARAGRRSRPGDVTILLGLGSNLGDREGNLREGMRLLAADVTIERVSSLYETEPWGYREQPPFLNLVCQGWTALEPRALLSRCQKVEREVGRTATSRYGPRVLDADILAYGELVVEAPDLVVPHPRLAERAFVLVPLAEVAPGWMHPVLKQTAERLLGQVQGREGVRLWGPSGRVLRKAGASA